MNSICSALWNHLSQAVSQASTWARYVVCFLMLTGAVACHGEPILVPNDGDLDKVKQALIEIHLRQGWSLKLAEARLELPLWELARSSKTGGGGIALQLFNHQGRPSGCVAVYPARASSHRFDDVWQRLLVREHVEDLGDEFDKYHELAHCAQGAFVRLDDPGMEESAETILWKSEVIADIASAIRLIALHGDRGRVVVRLASARRAVKFMGGDLFHYSTPFLDRLADGRWQALRNVGASSADDVALAERLFKTVDTSDYEKVCDVQNELLRAFLKRPDGSIEQANGYGAAISKLPDWAFMPSLETLSALMKPLFPGVVDWRRAALWKKISSWVHLSALLLILMCATSGLLIFPSQLAVDLRP